MQFGPAGQRSSSPKGHWPRAVIVVALLAVSIPIAVSVLNAPPASAAGTTTGTVFRDDNFDGAQGASEVGVAGVTVTAFDAAGTARGSTVSAADGTYSLSMTGTGPYRIEFTTIPAFLTPGPVGADSKTTVQFVPDGGAANISLGLTYPDDYCQNDPQLVTTCFVYGDQLGANSGSSTLRKFASSASGTAAPTQVASAGQIGVTFGIAYQRQTQNLFEGAYVRRHAGLGPNGIAAIYNGPNLFVDLGAVTGFNGAGTDGRPAVPNYDIDPTAFAQVGKAGFGDLDMSEDGKTIFAVNLGNNQLVTIPVGIPAVAPTTAAATGVTPAAGEVGQFVIPSPAGCVDPRAMTLTVHDGLVYAGGVCSAESTQDANDLSLYIYSFDPATHAFSAAPVFTTPLNYVRRCGEAAGNSAAASTTNSAPGCAADQRATWRPWVSTEPAFPHIISYAQPMFGGLDFDHGNLIIGLRDRFGDQAASDGLDTAGGNNERMRTAGDLLRACGSVTAGWSIEANGTCGGTTTPGAGTNQGPGGGEYYNTEFYDPFHDETATGSVAQIPGHNEVASTMFDPINTTFTGGVGWFTNTGASAGQQSRPTNYQVYGNGNDTFRKANGLGDLEALCDEAPIEIGNRVWRDNNGNGIQDPGEPTFAGVTVNLYDPTNTVVGTTTTDANGEYLFNAGDVPGGVLPNTAYQVKIDNPVDFAAGGALEGLRVTTTAAGTNTSIDSNAVLIGGFPNIAYTTGAAGANDHTLDAGLRPSLSLGDVVWDDLNNNGIKDGGENGVGGVRVKLFDATNTEVPVGPDGVLGTADDAPGGVLTGGAGDYLFTNLLEGDYHVEISTLPAGYISSHDPASGATPNNDTNNDDNGTGTSNGTVVSNTISLSANAEPINDGDTDANTNRTVDFGIFHPSPAVTLKKFTNGFDAQGATGATGPSGPGDAVNNPVVGVGSTVSWTYVVTNTGNTPLVSVAVTDDQGVTVSCPQTTLAPGANMTCTASGPATVGQYTNNGSVSATSQPNVGGTTTPVGPVTDISHYFAQGLSLGNLVWVDTNDDGLHNNGEVGLAGVTVKLFDSTHTEVNVGPDGILGNADDAPGGVVTDAGGLYRFQALAPGSYTVEISNVPSAYRSSTDPASGGTPNNDVNDDDNGPTRTYGTNESNAVTLSLGGEPINDGDADANTNLTVDFGLFHNQPGITLKKFTNGFDAQSATGATGPTGPGDTVNNPVVTIGSTITWTYVVTNTGNEALVNIAVTDDQGVVVSCPATTLAVGASMTCTASGIAAAGQYGNVGTVNASAISFPGDDPIKVEPASDPSHYFAIGLSLGNLVWDDFNDNGVVDPGEPGINGVTVKLFDNLNAEVPVGPDGVLGTPDDALGGVTTSGTGAYFFTNLVAGDYHVQISNLPAGYRSSTDPVSGATPNNDIDNDDNGQGTGTGPVNSAVVTLSLGGEPVNDADTDANTNTTVDFGLFAPHSLGNQVWTDTNNDGVVDGGETGIDGVTVSLYADANNDGTPDGPALSSQVTSSGGFYLFTNLQGGSYVVGVDLTTVPAGMVSSTGAANGYEPASDPDNDFDNDDNGTTVALLNAVLSAPVTLGSGTEPTGEAPLTAGHPDNATDNNSNLTVDFGFWTPAPTDSIKKFTNGFDAQGATGSTGPTGPGDTVNNPVVAVGSTVNWTYVVTNTGNTPLVNIVVTDDQGVTVTCPQTTLAPGASMTCTASGTAVNGQYANSGTVNAAGQPLPGGPTAPLPPATDISHYFGTSPGVTLKKFTNGFDAQSATGATGPTGPADTVHNPVVAVGSTITWTYVVTNTGNVAVDNVIVTDSDPSVSVSCPGSTLAVGATLTCSATGVAHAGQYANTGTLTAHGLTGGNGTGLGPVTDPSHYFAQGLSLGNLVWNDHNDNGVVDAGEPGVVGVTVKLFDILNAEVPVGPDGILGTPDDAPGGIVTNASGGYTFSALAPGDYHVEISNLPAGMRSATDPATGATPNNDIDNDDNGQGTATGPVNSAVVTLSLGGEPVNDADTDANTNTTVDFGLFAPHSLGNQVWTDTNNDGVVDGAETGIDGVKVSLYADANNDGTPDGAALATQVTSSGGFYLFTELVAGTYVVGVDSTTVPAGMVSSTGVANAYEPAPDPDTTAVDADDNGTTVALVSSVLSGPVTLVDGADPTGEPATPGHPDSAADNNSDATVDFGFWTPSPTDSIKKLTNGFDAQGATGPTGPTGPGDTVNNPVVAVGSSVAWTYVVTNTGNTPLVNIAVTDDRAVTVTCPQTTLAPGASMTCTASGTAVNGQYTNNGTVTADGQPLPGGPTAPLPPATDISHYFGTNPGITLRKFTNGFDAQSATGTTGPTGPADTVNNPVVAVGSAISWTYVVTNTGNVAVDNIVVTDSDPSVTVVCPGTTLAVGASLTCTASGIAHAGQYANTGTLTAHGLTGDNGTSLGPVTDPSHYFAQGLSLGNFVWNDANNNGVVNPGETGVAGVTVKLFDNLNAEVPVGPDGILGTPDDAPGGVVTDISGGYTFSALAPGDYHVQISNLPAGTRSSADPVSGATPNNDVDNDDNGTGTGSGTISSNPVTLSLGGEPTNDADADANTNTTVDFGLFQPRPGVTLKKFTNGFDAQSATGATGPTGPGDTVNNPVVYVGDAISWTYVVTNTGNTSLVNVGVTDDQGVTVTCPQATLAVGASMTCTATGVATAGQYGNIGTVNASSRPNPGDTPAALTPVTDPSHYFAASPLVTLKKFTNGFDAQSGTGSTGPTGPADTVNNPVVAVGSTVTWTYVVTNDGNVNLVNIAVSDSDPGVVVVCPPTPTLAPGASVTCTATGTARNGQYANVGTVHADSQPSPTAPVQPVPPATDPSHYFGQGLTMGNLVWMDGNNDGLVDNGESGVVGVTVRLLDASNSEINVGPDGILGTADDAAGGVVTDAGGQYRFQGLPPGDYKVSISNLPSGVISSGDPASGAAPNNDIDNDDNGVGTGNGTITSNAITLAVNSEPITDGDLDNNSNMTVDFGLFSPAGAVGIKKFTNGSDAQTASGPVGPTGPGDTQHNPVVAVGGAIAWTYVVTNTGNVALVNIVVTDSDLTVTVSCPQAALAIGASMTCTANSSATAGQYANIGSVTADGQPNPGDTPTPVTPGTDPSHYYGSTPSIDLVKYTNTKDATGDANVVPGPYVPVGSAVTWYFVVTNTGNVPLTEVAVTDDDAAATVTCPKTTLAAGEQMECQATGTAVAGQYVNNGTVIGTPPVGPPVTHTDPSHYFGSQPAIDIVKYTNTKDATGDANVVTGPVVPVGSAVTWYFVVHNTGNVALTAVTVTDDDPAVTVTCPKTTLAVDESMTCTAPGTATAGQYVNNGSVTGTPPVGPPVTHTDPSHYFGSQPGIDIVKYTNTQDATGDANVAPGPSVTVGSAITWFYVVTNTGNVDLTKVTVTDDDPAVTVTCPATTLAVGATLTCTATGTATAGQYANVGTVTGTPSVGTPVTAEDSSHYTGTDSAVSSQQRVDEPITGSLPVTGSDAGRLGAVGLAMLGAGLALVQVARRRREQ